MNILITETAYRDIWSTAERLATLSAASSLAFIDGLEETLHLMARRFEREAGGATVAPEAIRYVTRGKYLVFYTVSETDLVVLHVSDSAAEIEMMLGDRTRACRAGCMPRVRFRPRPANRSAARWQRRDAGRQ